MEKYKVTYLSRGMKHDYEVNGINIIHATGVFIDVVGWYKITKIELIDY